MGLIFMEERESKLPAPLGMDGDQKTEKERLITRKKKKKRKGTPRKLVLCNENFSISESFQQRPTEYFSNQEGLDLSRTGGEFLPYSLITNAGEGSYGIVSMTGHVSLSLTLDGNNGYKVLIILAGNNDSVFGDCFWPFHSDFTLFMLEFSKFHEELLRFFEEQGHGSSSRIQEEQ